MTLRLVLIRHGETEWSKDGRHTGRTDIALTEQGVLDAQSTAATLATYAFGSIYSSPLRRAVDSAAHAGYANPQLDDDLMEWDYGDVEGLTNDQIVADNPHWSKWDDDLPGGERVGDVGRRADRFIERVSELDHDVAVFAHGHLLSIVIARWLDLSPSLGKRFPLHTATLSVLSNKRRDRVIEMVNHRCSGAG